MTYVIRTVRSDEWKPLRELRLVALADPVAPIAFTETLATATAHPESV